MLFLIALAAAAVVGFVLWKAMTSQPPQANNRSNPPRPGAPDDDPEFLRQLGEKLRREGEDPPRRR
ncbi:MAG TPA: hypothetical protein VK735_10755 [Pseudonocardia sp.]|jgi:hypothetical protein|uniref:hypothetical protein n=1 Tax=Pseudonocardia sp. TaxID=60912 RepID=UPI002B8B0089|nr:hypothetical protein [Pseudonocardia sp.]HTF47919.1 hypothetical protein [Pseudonocardia sp.]